MPTARSRCSSASAGMAPAATRSTSIGLRPAPRARQEAARTPLRAGLLATRGGGTARGPWLGHRRSRPSIGGRSRSRSNGRPASSMPMAAAQVGEPLLGAHRRLSGSSLPGKRGDQANQGSPPGLGPVSGSRPMGQRRRTQRGVAWVKFGSFNRRKAGHLATLDSREGACKSLIQLLLGVLACCWRFADVRLKILRRQRRAGSTPAFGTNRIRYLERCLQMG